MKTYHEAYVLPAIAVLGLEAGREVAAYRFCKDLATFATAHRYPYTVKATAERLALRDRVRAYATERGGSPFITITGPAGVTTGPT